MRDLGRGRGGWGKAKRGEPSSSYLSIRSSWGVKRAISNITFDQLWKGNIYLWVGNMYLWPFIKLWHANMFWNSAGCSCEESKTYSWAPHLQHWGVGDWCAILSSSRRRLCNMWWMVMPASHGGISGLSITGLSWWPLLGQCSVRPQQEGQASRPLTPDICPLLDIA